MCRFAHKAPGLVKSLANNEGLEIYEDLGFFKASEDINGDNFLVMVIKMIIFITQLIVLQFYNSTSYKTVNMLLCSSSMMGGALLSD